MEMQKLSYYAEISNMMFSFGDSHQPNPDTVRLVESIVLKQLRIIIQEASKYSDGKNLKGEELVFLLRHNKYKMHRFIKYIQNKESSKNIESKVIEIDVVKPKNHLLEFIECIDETGELTDLSEFDEVKHEYKVRADRISVALDEKKYLEYSKARRSSFNSKNKSQNFNFEKLRLWVDPKQIINFSTTALDVLSYFAYETVFQLIDFALLVRIDSKRTTDPLSVSYFNQTPITTNEVKEVIRRIYSPQAGCLNFGNKLPETHYVLAL